MNRCKLYEHYLNVYLNIDKGSVWLDELVKVQKQVNDFLKDIDVCDFPVFDYISFCVESGMSTNHMEEYKKQLFQNRGKELRKLFPKKFSIVQSVEGL